MGEEDERRMNKLQSGCGCGSGSGWGLMNRSNIGYKLLKKQGWVEGTGLGASLQGRLEPVETHLKINKKGLGADNPKLKPITNTFKTNSPHHIHNKERMSKKEKALSKRMRKMVEEEKRRQEKEFDQAFFREFWPDNV